MLINVHLHLVWFTFHNALVEVEQKVFFLNCPNKLPVTGTDRGEIDKNQFNNCPGLEREL